MDVVVKETELDRFFTCVLEFPDWKEVRSASPYDFVRRSMQKWQYCNYFHNVFMSTTPPEARRVPTPEEAIDVILQGSGGVCIHQNYVFAVVLKSLGLDAYISAGQFLEAPEDEDGDGNHCMCIWKKSNFETYVIDVGCPLPLDEPVPLHDLPYGSQSAGFRFEYRYNKIDDIYERWQLDGNFIKGPFEEKGKEIRRYRFTIRPKDFEYFQKTLVNIFTNPEKSIFLREPLLFRCLDADNVTENGRRYVIVFGKDRVWYDKTDRKVTSYKTFCELEEDITNYFPKLPPHLVKTSLNSLSSTNQLVTK